MKMKKHLSLFLAVLLLCGALTACGSSSLTTETAVMGKSASYAVAEEAIADTAAGALSNGTTEAGTAVLPENRKFIITVYMSAETDDLDAMTASLEEQIAQMGGYVEDQSIYNGSTYSNYRYRNANLTIRIPAENADAFTDGVSGISNVISKQKNLEDITLSYVATESRMTALQTEETRLLELLAKAETMSDLLEIEARLTDVRYELESVTSQMRLYDNQVNYATIHLSIEEVQEYTPVEEPGFFERIRDGFKGSLEGLWEGVVDVIAWIIISSPYLVVFAVLAVVIVLLVKRVRKNKAKRQATKDEPK